MPLHSAFDPHLQVPLSHVSDAPEQAADDPHLHIPLSHVSLAPEQASDDPHLQMPSTQVFVVPEQNGTVAEHAQMLLVASQYGAADRSLQDEAVPHLQAPETQVSSATVHGVESEQSIR